VKRRVPSGVPQLPTQRRLANESRLMSVLELTGLAGRDARSIEPHGGPLIGSQILADSGRAEATRTVLQRRPGGDSDRAETETVTLTSHCDDCQWLDPSPTISI